HAVVADSRRKTDSETRTRAAVWDSIVTAGLAARSLGSESSGKVTRYYATKALMALRKIWRLEDLVPLDLKRNTQLGNDPVPFALVYIHSGTLDPTTGDPLPPEQSKVGVPLTGGDHWEHVEDVIELFNENVLNFSWKVKLTDPATGKTFTHPVL